MKGYIGSVNIDMNLCLCMLLVVVVYKCVFGEDVVFCDYIDLECIDLLVIIGSNMVWVYLVFF